jgi:NTE family protein
MNGYHNRPDVHPPFTEDGFYITGDVFRQDEAGFHYFIGRTDDMFVSGGENIYPADVERVQTINELLGHAADSPGDGARGQEGAAPLQAGDMHPVDVLTLLPSRSLNELALNHLGAMPGRMRALLRAMGVSAESGRRGGGALLSYLLFESAYTRELLELGYADTMRRIEEVTRFFQEARA